MSQESKKQVTDTYNTSIKRQATFISKVVLLCAIIEVDGQDSAILLLDT